MESTSTPPKQNRSKLQRPKGTQDILPGDIEQWQVVEATARKFLQQANYQELRTPIFEATELFARGVGETTDIVNKEMYTFEKGDRSLTLRPENTAGVVRAYIENGMERWPKPVKLFYIGPMFRYERPQAGRQRQFHQLGVEIFGLDTPAADAEAILMALDLLKTLNLPNLALEINNIGCPACRDSFKTAFRKQVEPFLTALCETCQGRYVTNPLRMLDCKEPGCQQIYGQGPVADFLEQDNTCNTCQTHFTSLKGILDRLQVPYRQNKRLVRGLDYYTRTVFEITSTNLGAQNAVCGGGRYNGLVESLGGPPTPAVGWGLGLERLMMLLPKADPTPLDYYLVAQDSPPAFELARALRAQGYRVEMDLSGKAFGKQLAQADKLKARFAMILGETEVQNLQVTVKNLQTGEQSTVSQGEFLTPLSR